MDFNEALIKLKANPELLKKFEEAVGRNADTSELEDIIVAAGFDAIATEALVVEYQQRRGFAIADDGLDEGLLKAVAGGTLHNCEMPAAEGMTDCEQIAIPNRPH